MKKNIILEVSRIKEIMGLISEQEKGNITPNSWKEYAGGEPAALFEEKSTSTSKKYMDSQLEGDTILNWKTTAKFRVSYDNLVRGLGEDRAKSIWTKYGEWKSSPIVDGYLYFKIRPGGSIDDSLEDNPDFIRGARTAVGSSIPHNRYSEGGEKWNQTLPGLTSEIKLRFMKQIDDFVKSEYGGNYGKAERKIESIVIKKGKFTENEKDGEEQPEINALYTDYRVSGVDGIPFVNNEWGVSENIKSHIQQTKAAISQILKQNPGVKAKISTKAVINGQEKEVPYTISTSASRYRNTGQAENMSFIQLSQKRAEEIHKYIISELGGLVKFPNPVLDIKGENGDGSSGPNPPSPYKFSTGGGEPDSYGTSGDRNGFGNPLSSPKDYNRYKYCRVVFVVSFTGADSSTSPSSPSGGSFGEWSIKIKTKQRKKIEWPPLDLSWKPGKGRENSGGGHIACAAYN
jgi:hypothetical protein